MGLISRVSSRTYRQSYPFTIMGKAKATETTASDKPAAAVAQPKGGVSILTVFLVVGVTNAVLWFGISSMNLQTVEDWNSYKTNMQTSLADKLKSANSDVKNYASKQAVEGIAKVSSENTKTLAEIKTNLGGFQVSEINAHVQEIDTTFKNTVMELKETMLEHSRNDATKQIESMDERLAEIKTDKINEALKNAENKQAEIYKLIDGLKKTQGELTQKIQGLNSANSKTETNFADKVSAIESSVHKTQGDIVKIQEVATQAESFGIWHSSVGDELEAQVDSLIKSETATGAKIATMQAQVLQIPSIQAEFNNLAESFKRRDKSKQIQEMHIKVNEATDALKAQDAQIDELKNDLLKAQDKIADFEAAAKAAVGAGEP